MDKQDQKEGLPSQSRGQGSGGQDSRGQDLAKDYEKIKSSILSLLRDTKELEDNLNRILLAIKDFQVKLDSGSKEDQVFSQKSQDIESKIKDFKNFLEDFKASLFEIN